MSSANALWLERHRRALAKTSQREHDPSFSRVIVRGAGARVWDADGTSYIDLTCGYSTSNFGHAFPPIVEAAREQIGELAHLTGTAYPAKIELAERLIEIFVADAPCFDLGRSSTKDTSAADDSAEPASRGAIKVIFNATGARAIETAWKAAVAHRPGKLIVLSPGFHGRSIATSALSDQGRQQLAPSSGTYQVWPADRYPYCSCCPLGLTHPACDIACGLDLFELITESPQDISAILVEPALGARGYVFPPAAFFQKLRQLTRQAGVLMIADEIQTGLGRCGDWLLSRQQGWEADLVVLGKSLGGGLASLSAVIGRAEILDAIPSGTESETFAASPFACRVGLAVLSELHQGPWMTRGARTGAEIRDAFAAKVGGTLGIAAVEGQGACCALEFATATGRSDRQNSSVLAAQSQAALHCAKQLLNAGMLVHYTGMYRTRVVLLPPLTINDEELAVVIKAIGELA